MKKFILAALMQFFLLCSCTNSNELTNYCAEGEASACEIFEENITLDQLLEIFPEYFRHVLIFDSFEDMRSEVKSLQNMSYEQLRTWTMEKHFTNIVIESNIKYDSLLTAYRDRYGISAGENGSMEMYEELIAEVRDYYIEYFPHIDSEQVFRPISRISDLSLYNENGLMIIENWIIFLSTQFKIYECSFLDFYHMRYAHGSLWFDDPIGGGGGGWTPICKISDISYSCVIEMYKIDCETRSYFYSSPSIGLSSDIYINIYKQCIPNGYTYDQQRNLEVSYHYDIIAYEDMEQMNCCGMSGDTIVSNVEKVYFHNMHSNDLPLPYGLDSAKVIMQHINVNTDSISVNLEDFLQS